MATTTVVFTYPNGKGTELLDRYASNNGYKATLSDGSSNPETKLQFFERTLKEFVANSIRADKAREDADAARIAAIAAINSEIPIT